MLLQDSVERLFRSEITQTILGDVQGSFAQMDLHQRQVYIYDFYCLIIKF